MMFSRTILTLEYKNDRIQSGDNYLVQHNNLNVRQSSSPINLLTLQLQQDFRLGIFNWQNVLTFQKSSKADILPVPTFNAYSNLFIRFKIARVLDVDLGVDGRYFTSYYAQSTYLESVLLVYRRPMRAVQRLATIHI